MIRIKELSQSVDTSEGTLSILQGINLEIKKGSSLAIVGASGSGKSTLLGLMAGLDSPSQGEIWLADQDITAMTEEQRAKLRGREVGFIFQNFQLLPALTAQENVMLPMEVKELGKQAEQQAQLLLERVGLGERLHHYPKQLSGGEQQRVAIARAFASQARILFADEPTGNLDSRTGDYVAELLFELNREMNTTLVLVTHDRELAARCDRQVEIHAGRISDHEASH